VSIGPDDKVVGNGGGWVAGGEANERKVLITRALAR